VLTEQDGSFRRLMETVRERQSSPIGGRPGRPPKNRVSTTGHFALPIHESMKILARKRTEQADHVVSTSDLYNEAATQLITDLHGLLGDELRLPAGAVSLSGILGLRELLDRPVVTPLRELDLNCDTQQRTTLYIDQSVWDALIEMSLRFGLSMRRTIHIHRLLELAAAWFLAGLESKYN
jgi:hypothetical protein